MLTNQKAEARTRNCFIRKIISLIRIILELKNILDGLIRYEASTGFVNRSCRPGL